MGFYTVHSTVKVGTFEILTKTQTNCLVRMRSHDNYKWKSDHAPPDYQNSIRPNKNKQCLFLYITKHPLFLYLAELFWFIPCCVNELRFSVLLRYWKMGKKNKVIRKLILNWDLLLLKHKYGISVIVVFISGSPKEILIFLKQAWKDDENKFWALSTVCRMALNRSTWGNCWTEHSICALIRCHTSARLLRALRLSLAEQRCWLSELRWACCQIDTLVVALLKIFSWYSLLWC